jgi:hypothetical protein
MSSHDAHEVAQSGHIRELLAWIRVNSLDSLRRELERALAKRQDYLTYENTDGSRNQAMVAKEAGVSQPTVSRKWSMWRDLCLIYE